MMATNDLPAIPVVATRVMQLAGDEQTTAGDLAGIIASDPAVAARVLRMSNSSFFGAQGKIQTLPHAIMILGFVTLKSVVVASAIKQVYQPLGDVEKKLWEHSVGAGLASRIIAKGLPAADPDEAFVCGLFHDIGKQVMNCANKQKYSAMLELVEREGVAFADAEKMTFQFTHGEAGALIINKWGLPKHLADATYGHHNPDQSVLSNIACLSNLFCHRYGVGTQSPDEGLDVAGSAAAQNLALDEKRIESLMESFIETYSKDKGFLN